MSSPKLKRVKRRNPGLASLLDALVTYIRFQLRNHQQFIVPKLAAVSMRLTDGEAFVLLNLLVDAGILERRFNVFCRATGALIDSVPNLEQLDEIPTCNECGQSHPPDDLKVEVAFKVINSKHISLAA